MIKISGIKAKAVSKEVQDKIEKMHQASQHKRGPALAFVPTY